MASALIGGLIADGYDPTKIWATDPQAEKLAVMQAEFGIRITPDNNVAVRHADIVVLAVKPQVAKTVVSELANAVQTKKPLIISILAGVSEKSLCQWLGEGHVAVVRCMPNTPALTRCGATGLYANAAVSAEQKNQAESILRAVGVTVWVNEEKQIDIVTALSGSGPAYFFRIMEVLEQAAVDLGLPADTAHLLTLQTCLGAARIALESNESLKVLREHVTSPGGTTQAALNVLQEGLPTLLREAVNAAYKRAEKLSEEL